jgi:hypothetical protein
MAQALRMLVVGVGALAEHPHWRVVGLVNCVRGGHFG